MPIVSCYQRSDTDWISKLNLIVKDILSPSTDSSLGLDAFWWDGG